MSTIQTILLAGLGNTGSHLAPLLARMKLADRFVLVDPDRVEAKNVAAQAYAREDAGQAKVDATAKRLFGINADLHIERHFCQLEDLPLGNFSGTVVLCLDQNAARQVAAERSWAMGGLLLDVAVNGRDGLTRVTRIERDTDRACLECAWPDRQYDNLPVRNSCHKTPPTNAPAALGSLAASLAALQILSPTPSDSNTELVSSVKSGEMWISKLRRNESCRFRHHTPSAGCMDSFDFSARISKLFTKLDTSSIELPGFSFVGAGRCEGCGLMTEPLLLNRGLHETCQKCDAGIEFPPFHARQKLEIADLSLTNLRTSINAVGLRPGDVVRADRGRWVQLGLPSQKSQPLLPNPHA